MERTKGSGIGNGPYNTQSSKAGSQKKGADKKQRLSALRSQSLVKKNNEPPRKLASRNRSLPGKDNEPLPTLLSSSDWESPKKIEKGSTKQRVVEERLDESGEPGHLISISSSEKFTRAFGPDFDNAQDSDFFKPIGADIFFKVGYTKKEEYDFQIKKPDTKASRSRYSKLPPFGSKLNESKGIARSFYEKKLYVAAQADLINRVLSDAAVIIVNEYMKKMNYQGDEYKHLAGEIRERMRLRAKAEVPICLGIKSDDQGSADQDLVDNESADPRFTVGMLRAAIEIVDKLVFDAAIEIKKECDEVSSAFVLADKIASTVLARILDGSGQIGNETAIKIAVVMLMKGKKIGKFLMPAFDQALKGDRSENEREQAFSNIKACLEAYGEKKINFTSGGKRTGKAVDESALCLRLIREINERIMGKEEWTKSGETLGRNIITKLRNKSGTSMGDAVKFSREIVTLPAPALMKVIDTLAPQELSKRPSQEKEKELANIRALEIWLANTWKNGEADEALSKIRSRIKMIVGVQPPPTRT